MWKIFKRRSYSIAERRRQREEKERMREKAKVKRRRHRKERWRKFRQFVNSFLAHPFSVSQWWLAGMDPSLRLSRQKQTEERRRRKAREKARRRRKRIRAWQNFRHSITNFLSDPFAKSQLSPLQKQRLRLRRYRRHNRKAAWQKWWMNFKKNPWRTIIPRKKRRSPEGGYLYVYRMSKQERKELRRIKIKQIRENFKKLITTGELRQKFMFSVLHSTAYFVFSFMIIWVIYQGVTILVASSFQIPVIWYYYQLKFPLDYYSPLYTRHALIVIFAMGPILSLMLAFVFLRLFFTKNAILKRFQLFYLWGFINGCNMFFGAYIVGIFTRTEFIYTSAWLFMSTMFNAEEIIFTTISFVMLIIIGRIVTPMFLLSSGSVTMVKPEFRVFFIVSQVILPWLVGMLILFLITLPNYYIPFILKTITPGLILIPTLFLYDSLEYENIHKSGVIHHNYFKWSIVIASIALLFFYRFILSWGLKVL